MKITQEHDERIKKYLPRQRGNVSMSNLQSPEGIALLNRITKIPEQKYILMDRAYEGEKKRGKALEKGYSPVVPPKSNRKDPWEYDKKRYKQRNETERYFLRLKRFCRIFTRYDKLGVFFCGFIYFAMIVDAI